MPKADLHSVRDDLVRDLTSQVRERGAVPDMRPATEYIIGILEGMDRKAAEAKPPAPKTQPKPERNKAEVVAAEYKRRTGNELTGSLEVQRNAQQKKLANPNQLEAVARARLQRRLAWINSKPDLRKEIQALVPGLNATRQEVREKAANKIRALLAKSDRLYGREWWKPEPKKLIF